MSSKHSRPALKVMAMVSPVGSPRDLGATRSEAERHPGALFVFEGPDGTGKSTLVSSVKRALTQDLRHPVTALAFPGREPGTLGHHVYALHHDPHQLGVRSI